MAQAEFGEIADPDVDDLARAMGLPSPELVRQRLQSGRRCFTLRIAGQIVTYGWVTRGPEQVGELERQFHLHADESYIWHCGTVPSWRRQRCYSALLSQIVHQLHAEGTARIWIGASRRNHASVRGLANAGFQPVIDLTYRRAVRLTIMWIRQHPVAREALVMAAFRIVQNPHERRLGPLVFGYQR
jgi:ribosomal protein S18 acetylase RimI-like enzyme